MIGYLKGQILEHSDGKMLIGMGDSQGMLGYMISVPQGPAYDVRLPGQIIELFVHTHVREDALDLYGFASKLEKTLFLTLLEVNGIGPKSALGILTAVNPSSLVQAITLGDQAFLTRIPGIGKKTAERLVVELRDTLKKKVDLNGFSSHLMAFGTSKAADVAHSAGVQTIHAAPDMDAALQAFGATDQASATLRSRVSLNAITSFVKTLFKKITGRNFTSPACASSHQWPNAPTVCARPVLHAGWRSFDALQSYR